MLVPKSSWCHGVFIFRIIYSCWFEFFLALAIHDRASKYLPVTSCIAHTKTLGHLLSCCLVSGPQNLRPEIPRCCPSSLANIMRKCWDGNASRRPEMSEVVKMLEAIDTSKGGGMIPEDQTPSCFCFAPSRGP